MGISCSQLNTALAAQTPVYSEKFLKDFISDMPGMPFVGRHQTEIWPDGASTIVFDKVHVGQPNYNQQWNVRSGTNCANTLPTSTYVAWGTTRDSYYTESLNLFSQLMSLDQLRTVPHVAAQMQEIYRNLRRIPMGFTADYLRTRMLAFNDTLYVCGSSFTELPLVLGAPSATGGITANASVLNLGSSGALPTSDLNLTYLNYYATVLGMRGYDIGSGLPAGMRGMVTHPRTFQRLVGLNPELKSQIRLSDFKSASPLYMPGKGINADPFGQYAPTFDDQQIRYQDAGNGYLERVLPYLNAAATTGLKPTVNPAYLNARYAITYLAIHPQATTLFTPKPKKILDIIPTVNSSMWGQWGYHNEAVLMYQNQDGTTCTINNANQFYFYWMCYLELGFKYDQRPLVVPVLHLIDGAGKACMVNTPICGTAPAYVANDTSDNPPTCAS